jgi:hypothetical protein
MACKPYRMEIFVQPLVVIFFSVLLRTVRNIRFKFYFFQNQVKTGLSAFYWNN